MPQPDFFNINPEIPKEETLESKFARERLEWSQKVKEMSVQMKSVLKVSELMTTVYTERQRCQAPQQQAPQQAPQQQETSGAGTESEFEKLKSDFENI